MTEHTDTEKYETTIGNTTYTVVSKYTGGKPYLDYVKAAIEREAVYEKANK